MSLDKNGSLEGAPHWLGPPRLLVILLALVPLFFDANKHLPEQVALQLLPRVTILADAHVPM